MSTSLHQPLNEPIYETIPEVSENDEQVYALPFDNLQHQALVSPVRSNKKAQFCEGSPRGCLRPPNLKQPPKSLSKLIRSTSLNKCDKNKNFESILLADDDDPCVGVI